MVGEVGGGEMEGDVSFKWTGLGFNHSELFPQDIRITVILGRDVALR